MKHWNQEKITKLLAEVGNPKFGKHPTLEGTPEQMVELLLLARAGLSSAKIDTHPEGGPFVEARLDLAIVELNRSAALEVVTAEYLAPYLAILFNEAQAHKFPTNGTLRAMLVLEEPEAT